MSLLDIGGGLGGIQHALFERGLNQATHVDASSAYLRAAESEANRRIFTERIEFLKGDFVDLAKNISPADIVTLDRVICCYDDMQSLVKLSAEKAKKIYGLVFPRDLWLFRVLLPIVNFIISLTGTPFRIFIHRSEDVNRLLMEEGLLPVFHQSAGFWQILVFDRK